MNLKPATLGKITGYWSPPTALPTEPEGSITLEARFYVSREDCSKEELSALDSDSILGRHEFRGETTSENGEHIAGRVAVHTRELNNEPLGKMGTHYCLHFRNMGAMRREK